MDRKKENEMDESYEDLFRRIREKCQREHWYGSDMNNPTRISRLLRQSKSRHERDAGRNELIRGLDPDDHPQKIGFKYPVASEEEYQFRIVCSQV